MLRSWVALWVALSTALTLLAGTGTRAWSAPPPAPEQGPADLLPPAPLELRLLTVQVPHSRQTLRPWVAVSSEYNDNVLAASVDREGDFSTVVTTGLTTAWHRRRGELSLGWAGGARAYARLDSLNDLFDQETILLSAALRLRPRVTTSLTNLFLLNSPTNVLSATGVFTGRGRSWSNTLAPAVTIQQSQRTSLRGELTAGIEHFESRQDEIFLGRALAAVDHVGSARWTTSVSGSFDYWDVGLQSTAWGPGGRAGVNVHLSRLWSASVAAGPMLITNSSGSATMAAGTAMLRRSLRRGEFRVEYDRSPGVAGEFGGPTVNQTVASKLVLEPRRRLTFALVPAYRTYRSPDGLGGEIDLRIGTADLRLVVPVGSSMDVLGSYSYLRQRQENREAILVQVQNRVLVGLRWGAARSMPGPEDGPTVR